MRKTPAEFAVSYQHDGVGAHARVICRLDRSSSRIGWRPEPTLLAALSGSSVGTHRFLEFDAAIGSRVPRNATGARLLVQRLFGWRNSVCSGLFVRRGRNTRASPSRAVDHNRGRPCVVGVRPQSVADRIASLAAAQCAFNYRKTADGASRDLRKARPMTTMHSTAAHHHRACGPRRLRAVVIRHPA